MYLLSRGRIVGFAGISFLAGIAIVSLGALSIEWSRIALGSFMLACSGVGLLRERRVLTICLCSAFLLFGMIRAWTERVPILSLSAPTKAMYAASVASKQRMTGVVPTWMVRARIILTERITKELPSEEASLLSGILYGETHFTKETKTTFRRAGILHVVAVSGANISILVLVIARFCVRLGASKRQAWAALVVSILGFILFVSPSASVTRAAIMGMLVELGPLCGRIPRPTRTLLIAACLFACWQPSALLLDAGFALSFLAMAGLILCAPYLQGGIPKQVPGIFREAFVSTVAATLFTTPYAIWAFQQWSALGLLTNLVIVPLVPWTMLFGAIALVLPIGPWVYLPVRGCLSFILWSAHLTDGVEIGVWNKLSFSWLWMVASYIILLSLCRLAEHRKKLIHK